jgi:hypothetical protein
MSREKLMSVIELWNNDHRAVCYDQRSACRTSASAGVRIEESGRECRRQKNSRQQRQHNASDVSPESFAVDRPSIFIRSGKKSQASYRLCTVKSENTALEEVTLGWHRLGLQGIQAIAVSMIKNIIIRG